MTMKEQFMVK